MKILLVEDDESIIEVLSKRLASDRFVVDSVKDGETGWTYGSTFEYDLIVLDLLLPKLDGISLCQRFRAEGFTTPILLLTAQDSSTAKVKGLDAGADDYVVKPFDIAELIARMRALLRRGSANPFPLLAWGNLLLNPSTCEVTYNRQPLTLTTKEYELLELLLRDSHHVFSAEEILDRLWSSEEYPAEATVRSHVRRVRQKLQAVGAPHDFITTLHGRGYYLNPSAQESPQSDLASASTPADACPPNSQVAYLAMLNETWTTAKPRSLEQLAVLSSIVADLQTGIIDRPRQEQAQHLAHKLAGNLGIFGLTKEMQMARHLEHLLNGSAPPQPQYASLMATLISDLQAQILSITSVEAAPSASEDSPLLLVVDQDAHFTQSLDEVAAQHGIRTAIAPTTDQAKAQLANESVDAVLLRLSPTPSRNPLRLQTLDFLQTLRQQQPQLPTWVLAAQDDLTAQLEIVRQGGKLLVEESTTSEQMVAWIGRSLTHSHAETKVMIVDDDQDWLRTLPNLLKPWGFRITTLADPQQFWTVLQSVIPDVLVLDIKMPQINGFELCQVLRSDPQWQRLPVLFLSVLTDPTDQNQAFTVGADDYLCKPVMGADLAKRILSRLERIRAWAS